MDIDALTADLNSDDVHRRRAAAEVFSRSGALEVVVALIRACNDPDEQVREFVNAALESVASPPVDVGSQLADQLDQAGPSGYWSATLLGRMGSDAAAWASALGQAIQTNSEKSVRQRAAWALGQIGPAATAGIPALEAAVEDADPRLARLASEALKKIAGDS